MAYTVSRNRDIIHNMPSISHIRNYVLLLCCLTLDKQTSNKKNKITFDFLIIRKGKELIG